MLKKFPRRCGILFTRIYSCTACDILSSFSPNSFKIRRPLILPTYCKPPSSVLASRPSVLNPLHKTQITYPQLSIHQVLKQKILWKHLQCLYNWSLSLLTNITKEQRVSTTTMAAFTNQIYNKIPIWINASTARTWMLQQHFAGRSWRPESWSIRWLTHRIGLTWNRNRPKEAVRSVLGEKKCIPLPAEKNLERCRGYKCGQQAQFVTIKICIKLFLRELFLC